MRAQDEVDATIETMDNFIKCYRTQNRRNFSKVSQYAGTRADSPLLDSLDRINTNIRERVVPSPPRKH